MTINTTVTSTQNSDTFYYSGVEILAANQSTGVLLDQGPFHHGNNGVTSDTLTFSTTHGASYILLMVCAAGSAPTVTISSTTLTFTLLVSGSHAGQNGSDGANRLTAIYGAYASGSLTNEIVTTTYNVSVLCGMTVASYSGVVSSSPVGVVVSPAFVASTTTTAVAFNSIQQGSMCAVAELDMNNVTYAAGAGTSVYFSSARYCQMALTNPAGIGVTAAATVGSGGMVVGGSASTVDAYVLGDVNTKYSILSKASGSGANYLSITPSGIANGVWAEAWCRYRDYTVFHSILSVANIYGSNWRAAVFPQIEYTSPTNWNFGIFVDLFMGPALTYINNYGIMLTNTDHPNLSPANLADWFWTGVQIIPSASAGITINTYFKIGPLGTVSSISQPITLASLRSMAVTAGVSGGASYTPDVNCTSFSVGAQTSSTDACDLERARLRALASAPTADQIAQWSDPTWGPDVSAYGDWPLGKLGQASGTGINTGVDLTDHSGNSHPLILGSAQFFLGKSPPTSFNPLVMAS